MNQAPTILGLGLSRVMVAVWLLMLFTGLSVVYVSHQCRLLYSELAVLEQQKNGLEVAWGQYLIEESALASLHRVEAFARQKLDMKVPVLDQIVVVKP